MQANIDPGLHNEQKVLHLWAFSSIPAQDYLGSNGDKESIMGSDAQLA